VARCIVPVRWQLQTSGPIQIPADGFSRFPIGEFSSVWPGSSPRHRILKPQAIIGQWIALRKMAFRPLSLKTAHDAWKSRPYGKANHGSWLLVDKCRRLFNIRRKGVVQINASLHDRILHPKGHSGKPFVQARPNWPHEIKTTNGCDYQCRSGARKFRTRSEKEKEEKGSTHR
jgi:hypothetical protein